MVPPGEQIVILKNQRLDPRGINPPTFPRPLSGVVPDQTARVLLMKSRFQLCNLDPQVYFHFGRTKKEREKLHDELKDHEVGLPGCVVFRHDRPSSKGGGVALYVKPNL